MTMHTQYPDSYIEEDPFSQDDDGAGTAADQAEAPPAVYSEDKLLSCLTKLTRQYLPHIVPEIPRAVELSSEVETRLVGFQVMMQVLYASYTELLFSAFNKPEKKKR